jgi:hypothetical protein
MGNSLEQRSEAADGYTETEMKYPTPVENLQENARPVTTPVVNASISDENFDKKPDAANGGVNSTTFNDNDDVVESKVQYNETTDDKQADKLSDITDCEEALSVAEEFMGQASELIGNVIDGDNLEIDKELVLNKILLSLKDAVNAVNKGIELISGEKLAEDINSMEAAVKARGYPDFDTFVRKAGYTKNANPCYSEDLGTNSPPLVRTPPITNKKADEPYDCLLKNEFTGTAHPDFKKGYYKRYGIKPVTGWVKEFNQVHGRPLTTDDCRDATAEEKEAMRIANQKSFNSIKRRNRSPKK